MVGSMFDVIATEQFDAWLRGLKDRQTRNRIVGRIIRMENGNLGDVKPVGSGVSEARLQFGPGYRLYFIQRGPVMIVLLCGGDKSTQSDDIAEAIRLASEWRN